MRGIAVAVACLLAQACAKPNAYKCTASDQCVLNGQAGTCAPEGYCAFPDQACPSGTRFESGAGGGLGGQCTAAPDAPLPPCGALGQQCCTGEQGSAGPCVAGTYCNAGMCDECVADMTFGHDVGCYLKKDHTVWCAGNQANGQLGNGTGSAAFVGSAVAVVDATGPIMDATAVGGGYNQNCAVRANGAVYCWGRNYDGQLGNNTTNDSNKAVQVLKAMGSGTAPLTGIVDVDGGGGFMCGHDTTGIVWCWGYNGSGQLGDGTTTTRSIAAPAMAGSAAFGGAESIYSADNFVCAKKGGDYLCWGNDGDSQFGDGSNGDYVNPTKIATTSALGLGNYHACWVNADTTVSCAGANYHGQMGNGSGNDYAGADQTTPGTVITEAGTPFTGAVELAGGGAMSCARTMDGHMYCWGDDKYGQLGGGSPTPYPAPVIDEATLMPLEHVDHIVGKYAHVCAHTTDAGWKCWGRGGSGELADGKLRSRGFATPLGLTCP